MANLEPGDIDVAAAQCVEPFEQLKGELHNQVDGARIAPAHNIGGPTAVSAVTILAAERDSPDRARRYD